MQNVFAPAHDKKGRPIANSEQDDAENNDLKHDSTGKEQFSGVVARAVKARPDYPCCFRHRCCRSDTLLEIEGNRPLNRIPDCSAAERS
jgi:hypothetical protein